MPDSKCLVLILLLCGTAVNAQLPDDEWDLEEGYRTRMLFLHSLVNYAYDLEWQFEWERRQFVRNALRINTGSVASDELLTDVDLNINQPLNEKWRFLGRFTRDGLRWQRVRQDQLLLGLERSILDSSAIYLTANPEYDKESIDVGGGYAFYKDNREQYVRLGVLAEDVDWGAKNAFGGDQEQMPLSLEWAVRLGLAGDWWLYSEGKVGSGFERRFPDPAESPEVSRHDRRENSAEFRVSRLIPDGNAWSAWVNWYDFTELKEFRPPGFDYDYSNTVLNVAVEHIRYIGDRHRLRLLAHYVDQQAESVGFRTHDYDRSDIVGGAFYEYLWPESALMFAYISGLPDLTYTALEATDSYHLDDYRDKVIAGWRYTCSEFAQIRISISHEISAQGFGGGALQFQMFF